MTVDISKYFCAKRNNETFVNTFIIGKSLGDVPIQNLLVYPVFFFSSRKTLTYLSIDPLNP